MTINIDEQIKNVQAQVKTLEREIAEAETTIRRMAAEREQLLGVYQVWKALADSKATIEVPEALATDTSPTA